MLIPQFVRLDALDVAHRERLIDELLALDTLIFDPSMPERTAKKMRGETTDECWAMLLRHRGVLVGFNVIWVYHPGDFVLWTSRAVMHPAYRKMGVTVYFAVLLYIWFRLRRPRVPIYTLNTMIHPSSFKLFSSRVPSLYPFPKTTLTPQERLIYEASFQHLGFEQIQGQPDFFAREVIITRMDEAERRHWAGSGDPGVRFFLKHNPEYFTGHAILAFNAVNLRVVVTITVKHWQLQLQKTWRRWRQVRWFSAPAALTTCFTGDQ